MNALRVLFVATSHDRLGDTNVKTGSWLEEISVPYYAFKEAGAVITIISPKGGRIPLDPKSQSVILSTFSTKKFMKDDEAMNFLSASGKLGDVSEKDFDLVFIPGGHGPMWDLSDNGILNPLLEAFYAQGKPIGAVCHGVVSLLSLKNMKGELLVRGKKMTCFSNNEEGSAGLTATVPFLLESKLLSLGGLYSKSENYTSHVVGDGNIITGQNAASSYGVVEKLLVLMKNRNFKEKLLQPCPN